MSSGENVLWIVMKTKDNETRPRAYFMFRTRVAALQFRDKKNKTARNYTYFYPQRATWGTN
jgi:hypothetical protein